MSVIKVGDIVRHTNWPDLTLIEILSVAPHKQLYKGKVVYGTGTAPLPSGNFAKGSTSLPLGYIGNGFTYSYARLATSQELQEAGLLPTTNPRPHAELIKAWADGAAIERYYPDDDTWLEVSLPSWRTTAQYRIKPPAFVVPEKQKPQPTREQLLKSTEASKRKQAAREFKIRDQIYGLKRKLEELQEQYAQKKIRREALMRTIPTSPSVRKQGRRRLSDTDVADIIKQYNGPCVGGVKNGSSVRQLAIKYGVDRKVIYRVLKGTYS